MRIFLFVFLMTIKISPSVVPDLPALRTLYQAAASERSSSRVLETLLSEVDNNSKPVLICYKGASSMLEAKYAWNPYSKYKKFNAGRMLIEKAISRDPNNIEMRILRYGIQCNLPGFLNYRGNMESDKIFLKKSLLSVKDKTIRDMLERAMAS